MLLGFLASCMSIPTNVPTIQTPFTNLVTNVPSIIIPTPTESSTATLAAQNLSTETQITSSSSQTPLAITPTNFPFAEIQERCLAVKTDFQPSLLTEGIFIFWSEDGISKLTPQGLEEIPGFPVRPTTFGYAISPDKKRLAYVNENNTELVVINTEGEKIASVRWQDNWKRWQDYIGPLPRWFSDHLVIFGSDVEIPGSVIILDPFTGKLQEFVGSFPDIYNPLNEGGFQTFWNDPTFSVFDSSLTRVVYLSSTTGKNALVLWDFETNTELWRLTNRYLVNVRPEWSQDNSKLIAALPTDETANHFEIFNITRDGQLTQLTNFVASYSFAMIVGELTWSPDRRFISFGLTTEQGDTEITRLMLYDTTENVIVDYCIQGDYRPPSLMKTYWSPDSQQLIVELSRSDDQGSLVRNILLVGPAKGYVVKMGENWQIIGWMAPEN